MAGSYFNGAPEAFTHKLRSRRKQQGNCREGLRYGMIGNKRFSGRAEDANVFAVSGRKL